MRSSVRGFTRSGCRRWSTTGRESGECGCIMRGIIPSLQPCPHGRSITGVVRSLGRSITRVVRAPGCETPGDYASHNFAPRAPRVTSAGQRPYMDYARHNFVPPASDVTGLDEVHRGHYARHKLVPLPSTERAPGCKTPGDYASHNFAPRASRVTSASQGP